MLKITGKTQCTAMNTNQDKTNAKKESNYDKKASQLASHFPKEKIKRRSTIIQFIMIRHVKTRQRRKNLAFYYHERQGSGKQNWKVSTWN